MICHALQLLDKQTEKEAPQGVSILQDLEDKFRRMVRLAIVNDLEFTRKRLDPYALDLSPQRMKELIREELRAMQEHHLLELDTDPAQLDGQYVEFLDVSNHDYALDEREIQRPEFVGLMTPLPHEA